MKRSYLEWALKHEAKKASTLDRGLRERVNALMSQKGLDGNRPFDSIGIGLNAITDTLEQHGIEVTGQGFNAMDTYSFGRPPKTFDVAFSNRDDPFSPIEIDNSMLSVSWQEMGSGRWEMIARLT